MRSARGQAVVELALGSVVFVVVLLVGIHLAEVAQLSLKVQEAQAFAVWQSTQKRVQHRNLDGSTNTAPLRATLNPSTGVGGEAKRRYEDFNGLDTVERGAVIKQALTRGTGVQVRCEVDDTLTFEATPTARPVMLNEGGLRCTSRASLEAIRMPRSFLQAGSGGWGFRASLFRTEPIPVCGIGFARNGACTGALAVLTNDWGLVTEETRSCPLNCPASVYRGTVQQLWSGGGGAGAAFASRYAGSAPTNASEFHFSYSGIESDYFDYVGGEGTPTFRTGGPAIGGGMVSQHSTAGACFLGRNDCR
ncbi:MAG: hypothetical protein AB1730_21300 [Myxococcota bacterium]